MAIAKNPKRSLVTTDDAAAEAFISKSGTGSPPAAPVATAEAKHRTPIMVRVPPDVLDRVDRAAKRLGLTRTAFLVSSAAEKVERMENN